MANAIPPMISQCFTLGQSVDKNSNSFIALKIRKIAPSVYSMLSKLDPAMPKAISK